MLVILFEDGFCDHHLVAAFLFGAVALWPAAVLLAPQSAPPLWPISVLALLSVCVLIESPRSHSVFRSSWLIVLTTILAANQAMEALVGP